MEEFEENLAYNDEDLDAGDLANSVDKLDNWLKFYSLLVSNYHGFEFHSPLVFSYEHTHYVFVEWYDEIYATVRPKKH